MSPNKSNMTTQILDELLPICKPSTKEIIDYLLSSIQSVAAGTIKVSEEVLSEICVEYKIQSNPQSPAIILQYESEADIGESVHSIPIVECEKFNKNNEICKDNSKTKFFNGSKGNSTLLGKCILNKKFHIGKKTLCCDICGKSFIHPSSMSRHKKIHTGEKPYACEECGKAFSTSSNLIVHKRIHNGEKPFQCGDCGKSFTQLNNLHQHKRIHSGEKPFKCRDCNKSFTHLCRLIEHKNIHTHEKSYTCEECGKSFTSISHRTKHKKSHSTKKKNFM